ncbi:hypothetical protein COT72_04155 [archaeon CG10_big_fil_rev_8_21_14_0_10_43_11]|nr:MAG: hypothetical protein COT72_04155 [archaeon CG10_big_fil_rev_8_21_14_0_10_43_11]
MIQTKIVSSVWNIPVYTDAGEFFGEVDDAIVQQNKVLGWKINATPESPIFKVLRGARGVIVPHQMVRAISDIMIISKAAVPSVGDRPSVEFEDAFE